MALQTPRRLPSNRPSLASQSINTASSPNLTVPHGAAMAHRKASLSALTAGGSGPSTPLAKMVGGDGRDLEVGDIVDVPGGMHGAVKFIGTVKGKKGAFAGVELSREYAARGKNDGDVDGIRYFTTSVPGAGIFLPLHRASKRASPSHSSDTFLSTPPTPSLTNYNVHGNGVSPSNGYTPPKAAVPKFSQSVGPGARAPSPLFKPKTRPSLARPESPFRKQPNLAPTPSRGGSIAPAAFSKSVSGAPRFTPSPAPGRAGTPKGRTPVPSRPFSRTGSRLGHHTPIEEDGETTPVGLPKTRPVSGQPQEEIRRLNKKLEERDKQLKEQAASLTEMEGSLAELQTLMAKEEAHQSRSSRGVEEDADATQLRAVIREKNEKIAMLTAEFDAHRADFRSTIDTLEMASAETERVYEKRVEDLMQEVRELQERGEDVESVARQLKQLEELVQELEEGLEDARRGEAEARGEVEFLRGEVERGRSELRREREKATAALKNAGTAMDGPLSPGASTREVEQRDDEIRGLKAIIHSLSSDPDLGNSNSPTSPLQRNGTFPSAAANESRETVSRLEREKKELQGLVERKTFREEELERDLDRLRRESGIPAEQRNSMMSNPMSDRTAQQDKRLSGRDSKGTLASWRDSADARRHDASQLPPMAESETQSSTGESALWCEICETGGHDILNCSAMSNGTTSARTPDGKRTGRDVVAAALKNLSVSSDDDLPAPLTPGKKAISPGGPPTAPLPNPFDASLVPGKGSSAADPNKWCALCERDGHDATNCPYEDAF
ncbi:hypothetical protein W97_01279 [Coniosporium apollinis CBS 100218]|uniref:CAP-Gly domain-containing protein n=1 Tax=Coniosporium apollinis (strain CBS 100218) TaxID=1168221 RepID=R7YJJ1_CONA1|nr:uncharacterized protein W97_01279 [Coniosporium apollinis CBS 100218]EON62060.1 hypothetical protein W97_01279 [Coniosporium apollinis CBS 100218]